MRIQPSAVEPSGVAKSGGEGEPRHDTHAVRLSAPRTENRRQPFGRIPITNCDSAPGADMKTAIDMASRAVGELS